MLCFVGLGIGQLDDITIKGKKLINKCDYIVLDYYTSIFPNVNNDQIGNYFNRNIIIGD